MNNNEKLCPFCAETIKLNAIKCKHCKSDISPQVETQNIASELYVEKKTIDEVTPREKHQKSSEVLINLRGEQLQCPECMSYRQKGSKKCNCGYDFNTGEIETQTDVLSFESYHGLKINSEKNNESVDISIAKYKKPIGIFVASVLTIGLIYFISIFYLHKSEATKHGFENYQLYLDAKANGFENKSEQLIANKFGVSTKEIYDKAIKGGFEDGDSYYSAIEKGFKTAEIQKIANSLLYSNFDDYEKGQAGGFKSGTEFTQASNMGFTLASEYRDALKLGFNNKDDYISAKSLGYPNNKEYEKGKLAGFSNYKEYVNAKNKGFEDAKLYRYAIDGGFNNPYEAEAARKGGFDNLEEYNLALSRNTTTKKEFQEAIDGNKMIDKCADGMSYERKVCSAQSIGKRFIFNGSVFNVKNEYTADIRLATSEGNYAVVEFRENVAAKFRKGESVKFAGTLTYVGTGIFISHSIGDAVILGY